MVEPNKIVIDEEEGAPNLLLGVVGFEVYLGTMLSA